jgi:hypothetical protein
MAIKYTLLILSISVLIFIFYRQYDFIQRQREYMTATTTPNASDSPYNQTDDSSSQMNGLDKGGLSKNSVTCSTNFSDSKNLPLKECCVKSSFNSAYDGTDVSIDALKQRIQEGYRFIDLNVFSADGEVYVGYSADNAPALISKKLLLSDALKQINDAAFSSTTAFDSHFKDVAWYPMFVHIRVYRTPNSKIDILSNVEKIINGSTSSPPSYTTNYLRGSDGHPIQINDCVSVSTLSRKIIFSMDILNILEIYAPVSYQNASTVPPETIKSLQKFVNILTGGSTFPAFYRYTEDSLVYRTTKLAINDESMKGSLKTNVSKMYISFPHPDDVSKSRNINGSGVIQPDVASFLLDRSIQFTPLRVYLADANLNNYIKMFEMIGTPFAPMAHVYQYLNTNSTK